jgi:hypothetical protein
MQPTDQEGWYVFLQEDSATIRTARAFMGALIEVVECSCWWPAHSSNLNPCDFYLCGIVKQNVYRSNPHIIEELKGNM